MDGARRAEVRERWRSGRSLSVLVAVAAAGREPVRREGVAQACGAGGTWAHSANQMRVHLWWPPGRVGAGSARAPGDQQQVQQQAQQQPQRRPTWTNFARNIAASMAAPAAPSPRAGSPRGGERQTSPPVRRSLIATGQRWKRLTLPQVVGGNAGVSALGGVHSVVLHLNL